jgi:hypothetical protein
VFNEFEIDETMGRKIISRDRDLGEPLKISGPYRNLLCFPTAELASGVEGRSDVAHAAILGYN